MQASREFRELLAADVALILGVAEARDMAAALQRYFSHAAFNEVVAGIERDTNWRYVSGPQPILTNARFNAGAQRAWLDYLQAMVVDLRVAVDGGLARSADEIAGLVFEFAKSINERPDSPDNPVYEFSRTSGKRILNRSLSELLLVWLPDAVRQRLLALPRNAVRDLRRDSTVAS